MQTIDLEFDLGNYRHTQIERHGDLAIYRQQHKEADVARFEVIRIRIERERVWPDGHVTPEREAYPGSAQWGTYGWTCHTLAEAQTLLAELRAGKTAEGEETEESPDA